MTLSTATVNIHTRSTGRPCHSSEPNPGKVLPSHGSRVLDMVMLMSIKNIHFVLPGRTTPSGSHLLHTHSFLPLIPYPQPGSYLNPFRLYMKHNSVPSCVLPTCTALHQGLMLSLWTISPALAFTFSYFSTTVGRKGTKGTCSSDHAIRIAQ